MAGLADREDHPAAVLVSGSAQWICESVNAAWCAVAGAPAADLVGEPIGALLPDRVVAEALGRLCDLAAMTSTRRSAATPAVAGSPRTAIATPVTSPAAAGVTRIRLELADLPGAPPHPDQMDQILEAASELVARFGPDLRVTAVNDMVLLVSGLAAEDIIGKTNREMGYPPAIADLWDTHHRQVFETGRPCTISYTLATVVGPRPYRSRITPDVDADGVVRSVTVRSWQVRAAAPSDTWTLSEAAGDEHAMWERFDPVPSAVSAARASIAAWLASHGRGSSAAEVTLAVSELATNAVMHAGTEFYLHAAHGPRHVRIALRDGSDARPVPREAGTIGGRGLPLVASLATRWGVDAVPYGGKVVWCEFDAGTPIRSSALSEEALIDFWADQ